MTIVIVLATLLVCKPAWWCTLWDG